MAKYWRGSSSSEALSAADKEVLAIEMGDNDDYGLCEKEENIA